MNLLISKKENVKLKNIKSLKFALLLFVLVDILFVCIIMTQSVSNSEGKVSAQSPPSPTPSVEQNIKVTPDADYERLNQRVDDWTRYLEILALVGSGIAILVGAVIGLNISHVIKKYKIEIKSESDKNLQEFKETKIEPILENSRNQLDSMKDNIAKEVESCRKEINNAYEEFYNIANRGAILNLEASTILLDNLSQTTQDMYQQQLKARGLQDNTINQLLAERQKFIEESRNITRYLVASLFRDKDVVQDTCQKLFALWQTQSEVLRSRSGQILEHMRHLADTWPPGKTRTEIQRLIDEIERSNKKQN